MHASGRADISQGRSRARRRRKPVQTVDMGKGNSEMLLQARRRFASGGRFRHEYMLHEILRHKEAPHLCQANGIREIQADQARQGHDAVLLDEASARALVRDGKMQGRKRIGLREIRSDAASEKHRRKHEGVFCIYLGYLRHTERLRSRKWPDAPAFFF